MKEAVTDRDSLEDYYKAFTKWIEYYKKCIEFKGSYFEENMRFVFH